MHRENMIEISETQLLENKKINIINIKFTKKMNNKFNESQDYNYIKHLDFIIKEAIELIENTSFDGEKKNKVVLDLLRSFFEKISDAYDKELLLKLLNNGTISSLINLLIEFSKGKTTINKKNIINKIKKFKIKTLSMLSHIIITSCSCCIQ